MAKVKKICNFAPAMKKSLGHISAFFAYAIFGFNIIICRDLSTLALVSPMGLLCFRAVGASVLFWIVSLFLPKEKVEKGDFLKIFIASMLGLFLTQVSFLKASTMTTPFDTSILTPLTPIFTMFIAAIALKEPITLKKAGGVAISFIGVIFLVFNTVRANGSVTETQPMGIVYMIGNCIFFALYLGIFRPLISKYHVVTFMKWMFLFTTIVAVPFDIKELVSLNMAAMPTKYLLELGFLILFATFVAYFLIPVGQKVLRPTVISLYGYLQPIIATVMGIVTGMDRLTWQKILAAALVFTGVILVNKSRAANTVDS